MSAWPRGQLRGECCSSSRKPSPCKFPPGGQVHWHPGVAAPETQMEKIQAVWWTEVDTVMYHQICSYRWGGGCNWQTAFSCQTLKSLSQGTFLVVQWLGIHLPMQGIWVWALVREDPTCRRATKPASHNYWVRVQQLLKPTCLEPMLRNKRSYRDEKPGHCNQE